MTVSLSARSPLLLANHMQMAEGTVRVEGEYIRKDGSPVPVEVSMAFLQVAGKLLVFVLAHDIIEHILALPMTYPTLLRDGNRSGNAHPRISSGYREEGRATEILAPGAKGFLKKPYGNETVPALVRATLDQAGAP